MLGVGSNFFARPNPLNTSSKPHFHVAYLELSISDFRVKW